MLAGPNPVASGSITHVPAVGDFERSRNVLELEDTDMELPDPSECDLNAPLFFRQRLLRHYNVDDFAYHSDCDSAISCPGSPSSPLSEGSEESGSEDKDGWDPPTEMATLGAIPLPPARPLCTSHETRVAPPPPAASEKPPKPPWIDTHSLRHRGRDRNEDLRRTQNWRSDSWRCAWLRRPYLLW